MYIVACHCLFDILSAHQGTKKCTLCYRYLYKFQTNNKCNAYWEYIVVIKKIPIKKMCLFFKINSTENTIIN